MTELKDIVIKLSFYIRTALSKGYSLNQIKEWLYKNGYGDYFINLALRYMYYPQQTQDYLDALQKLQLNKKKSKEKKLIVGAVCFAVILIVAVSFGIFIQKGNIKTEKPVQISLKEKNIEEIPKPKEAEQISFTEYKNQTEIKEKEEKIPTEKKKPKIKKSALKIKLVGELNCDENDDMCLYKKSNMFFAVW